MTQAHTPFPDNQITQASSIQHTRLCFNPSTQHATSYFTQTYRRLFLFQWLLLVIISNRHLINYFSLYLINQFISYIIFVHDPKFTYCKIHFDHYRSKIFFCWLVKKKENYLHESAYTLFSLSQNKLFHSLYYSCILILNATLLILEKPA